MFSKVFLGSVPSSSWWGIVLSIISGALTSDELIAILNSPAVLRNPLFYQWLARTILPYLVGRPAGSLGSGFKGGN